MENLEQIISIGRMEEEAKECVYSHDYDELDAIASRVLSSSKVMGSPDEFHNFAVNYAQTDDKKTACEILKLGLASYPTSVDLLADFIQYGVQCGNEGDCEIYFQKLQSIPKELWTWRGFDFSLDYLQFKLERMNDGDEYTHIRKEMIQLVTEFRKNMPYDERSYFAESQLYKNTEQETKILEKAMSDLSACPKCTLRYADLQFERGEYVKALESIERCILSLQTQPGISEGYAYFLSGLCKTSLIHKEKDYKNKERILDAYQDFQVAELEQMNLQPTYRKTIQKQTGILTLKSGISYVTNDE